MTTYRAILRFTTTGPAVTGEWSVVTTARHTWRGWIGLYGSVEEAIIRVVEDTGEVSRFSLGGRTGMWSLIACEECQAGARSRAASMSGVHRLRHGRNWLDR
ncbi:hypothetical protein [Streptomyces tubercidicus]|uniref:hypothetical protein n=1 Tax=Streptomyces tubercidicus TaxID=47759 RepID=UPI0034662993